MTHFNTSRWDSVSDSEFHRLLDATGIGVASSSVSEIRGGVWEVEIDLDNGDTICRQYLSENAARDFERRL